MKLGNGVEVVEHNVKHVLAESVPRAAQLTFDWIQSSGAFYQICLGTQKSKISLI